jgi:hypothetical protein
VTGVAGIFVASGLDVSGSLPQADRIDTSRIRLRLMFKKRLFRILTGCSFG